MRHAGYYVIDEPVGTCRAMVDRPVRVIVVVDRTEPSVRALLADVLRSEVAMLSPRKAMCFDVGVDLVPTPASPDQMRSPPAHRRTQAFIRARNDWRNDRRARGRKR